MFDFLEGLSFGQRLFAEKAWWFKIKSLHHGFYLAVKPDAVMPCPVLLVSQSKDEVKYQEILFRDFSKNEIKPIT